jgi:hypothetical protein
MEGDKSDGTYDVCKPIGMLCVWRNTNTNRGGRAALALVAGSSITTHSHVRSSRCRACSCSAVLPSGVAYSPPPLPQALRNRPFFNVLASSKPFYPCLSIYPGNPTQSSPRGEREGGCVRELSLLLRVTVGLVSYFVLRPLPNSSYAR